MKKTLCMLLTVAFTMGILGSANAEEKPKPKKTPEEIFKQMDKNSDGKLSFDEFAGKRADDPDKKAMAEKQFKAKDKDGDGSLSLEEFKAPVKKKKAD